MRNHPYEHEELHALGPQRSYPGDAREAAFLLGGIGTGNVSVGARGELRDWEIFNRPGKGNYLPYTFFAVWSRPEGGEACVRVLESRLNPPFAGSHGFNSAEVAGLPRLDASVMRGEYPFVRVDFSDGELPVEVSLEAFTPFIPLNADDSGIPGAIIRYTATNPGKSPVEVTVAGSLANAVGFDGYDAWRNIMLAAEGKNEYREEDGLKGLFYSAPGLAPDHPKHGTMALLTAAGETTVKPNWLEGGWWDGVQDFWDDFRADGRLAPKSVFTAKGNCIHKQRPKIGSLGICQRLLPGETKVFEFILAWCFPNRARGWDEDSCVCGDGRQGERNYYARRFADAWQAGRYLVDNLDRLEKGSRAFHCALFGSTLPPYVIDALAGNITVIRSATCFRLADGTLLGWEGCHDTRGCCEGSCTHVWNYAQTLAFLFPELERSMRMVEFNLETDEEGKMAFRTKRVFGQEPDPRLLPAADGQLGTMVRLYRDWKLSGDDGLLRQVWEKASRALDFAFSYWDADRDCVLDSQQHNTYDIEFYGPNSLTNSIFYAALKAGAEMASHLGDHEHATRYQNALEKGSRRMDELLWSGEYYVQRLDDVNEYRYQYGQGCLADQVLGQLLAHVAGLGYVLPADHVKKAVASVFEYNFRSSVAEHHNVQRTYILNDEKGLLLCSWPHGGRPRLPFVYSDEVWTGVEYQVAAHLIYEGLVEEGLTIVKAVRERHDGYRRNPWNEVECGHHYARSLASWALLPALSGFKYDMVAGKISFAPVIQQDDFRAFWSTGKAWGIYRQRRDERTGEMERKIELIHGDPGGVRLE